MRPHVVAHGGAKNVLKNAEQFSMPPLDVVVEDLALPVNATRIMHGLMLQTVAELFTARFNDYGYRIPN